jgi:hypothetical protein
MNITLSHGSGGPHLKPNQPTIYPVTQGIKSLDANILKRMLHPSHKIRDRLGDGVVIIDRARNTLRNLVRE